METSALRIVVAMPLRRMRAAEEPREVAKGPGSFRETTVEIEQHQHLPGDVPFLFLSLSPLYVRDVMVRWIVARAVSRQASITSDHVDARKENIKRALRAPRNGSSSRCSSFVRLLLRRGQPNTRE